MSILISMAVFSVSMSVSPGPVNFLALASGLNHGFMPSLKFVTGATLGFISLLLLIGLGIGATNESFPVIVDSLKYIGCAYIFYIGFKVYSETAALDDTTSQHNKPTFLQGWLMQWLNPKAWVACLAGCSAFSVYTSHIRLAQFLSIYFVICFVGIASWALLGKRIKIWISTPKHVRLFNKVMGISLCVLGVILLVQ
ncbi:LysE family translocator [Thalassotalea euphylliae]|uniref:LysE family translocator n=1 Tax=Thalassotalea euphylliae TaxID=1655234 RepID=UPI003626BC06